MSELDLSRGPLLDVSKLPRHATGLHTPLWWGTVLLIAIESTCFAVLFNTYLYVRNSFNEWPPEQRLQLWPGVLSTAALLLTLPPTFLYRRAACAERFRPMRRWLLVATGLCFVSIALRVWELWSIPFLWTGSAYASVVWTSFGMHTFEIVTGAVESIFMCVIVFRPRIELKTFSDVEASALFWFFSVLVWLPFAGLFYVEALSL
jgi:cytochrome c oxidase subunit III